MSKFENMKRKQNRKIPVVILYELKSANSHTNSEVIIRQSGYLQKYDSMSSCMLRCLPPAVLKFRR